MSHMGKNQHNLALNAKSSKIVELRQVLSRNSSVTTEIWTLRSIIQHPKSGVKVYVHFRGFHWRSLYAIQTTSSQSQLLYISAIIVKMMNLTGNQQSGFGICYV